ncbi:MAG: ABC transporter permease [Clostridiales bacterium]|nr:ABC transporter permease [Clostridiales bacterium]
MKKILSIGYVILVLAFIYIPIFLLIVYSFNEGKNIGVWEGFSFRWYERLDTVKGVVINTVLLAVISATIATILGTLGAIGIFYSKGKFGKYVNVGSQIPVVNSEVVTACALVMLLVLLGGSGSNRSIFGLYIGHIVLTAPFVVLSVIPKLKQMDSSLYEAALDLGDTPFQALWKVVIPQILPGVFTGFMLAITLSLDDYIITATLSPLGFDTISTAVYKSIALTTAQASKNVPVYRALTTIIFIITVAIVIVMNLKSNKKEKSRK